MTFVLDQNRYGIDVMSVDEIIPLPAITPLTQFPGFIRGFVNLRGTAIPVLDLKERFGMGRTQYELENDLVIVSRHDVRAGLIVDDVLTILEVDNQFVISVPNMYKTISSRFMSGAVRIGGDMFILLNLNTILAVDEKEKIFELAPKELESK